MLLDYAILKAIEEIEDGAWKKKIHEYIEEHRNSFGIDSVSLQTVGRHVATLQDEDLVSACILSPSELNREYIIGFKLTGAGKDHMNQLREDILRDKLLNTDSLLNTGRNDPLPKPMLLRLITDKFELSQEVVGQMNDDLTAETLRAAIIFHYFCVSHLNGINTDAIQSLVRLMAEDEPLRDAILPAQLREAAEIGLEHLDGTDLDKIVSNSPLKQHAAG